MLKNRDEQSSQVNIIKDYTLSYEPVEKTAFAEFIREKRKEYNWDNEEQISTKELGCKLGINYEMFRKILNQEKPTKKRDCIIAICVVLQLLPGEIDEALGLYQYMPGLDDDNPRDSFITLQLTKRPYITVTELNRRLIQRGFPGLDIQDKRDGKKKNPDSIPINQPYKTLDIKVHTLIDSDHYYGDLYNSLCTKYSPTNCRCTGSMILEEVDSKNCTRLIADTDGYLSSQTYKEDAFPISYNSLDDTGNLKRHFTELIDITNIEKCRLLNILNDTKNYHQRTSARLIGDSICIFTEEFNYSIPELGEYYLLTRINGKYQLNVYEKSAFMHFYLPNDLFKKLYGVDANFGSTEHPFRFERSI